MTTIEGILSKTEDRIPIGIQLLAFDNDPTSLLLLDNMLRQCHYNVTTTSDALTAMKLLRENKNKFDMVITDVDRLDTDGFKLLELARLEMDLPVILLSANGDTEFVTKGIACDHLLKPVRIEELKEMCQHVVGRNKFDRKDRYSSDGDEAAGIGNVDNNGQLSKKRKDQNEDEEGDERGHDNEDPSRQKKPRVVWSEEFIREFVAAFTKLGIERNVDSKAKLKKKRSGWDWDEDDDDDEDEDEDDDDDEDEDEDEDDDENGCDNKDPSPLNKPNFVWSEELSREFVAVFNTLGIQRDDNMDQSSQNKPRVEELAREFLAAFNQLGIQRNVDNNENEDHPHSLTFSNNIWDCPPCNVCGKICNTQALECEEPKCNFIVHWKCLHKQEK